MPDNTFQRLTPQQQQDYSAAALKQYFGRYEAQSERIKGWAIHETSRLAEDNASTHAYRKMTDELHYLLSSARDHLDVLRGFWDSSSFPPFAPFTLVRAALECLALGIWLQGGGITDKRVIRLLTLQWDQRQSVDTYTAAAGTKTEKLTEWLWDMLTFEKDQRTKLRQRAIRDMPTMTDILIDTDKVVDTGNGLSGLGAWRVCSGIAHGNQHFHAGVTTRSPTTVNGLPGVSHAMSFAGLALVLGPTVDYFDALVEVLSSNSQPRPGRPVPQPIGLGPVPPRVQ